MASLHTFRTALTLKNNQIWIINVTWKYIRKYISFKEFFHMNKCSLSAKMVMFIDQINECEVYQSYLLSIKEYSLTKSYFWEDTFMILLWHYQSVPHTHITF